jgi:hypothetical protein
MAVGNVMHLSLLVAPGSAVLEIAGQADGQVVVVPILALLQVVHVVRVFEPGVIGRDLFVERVLECAVRQQHIVVAAVRPAPDVDVVVEKGGCVADGRAGLPVGGG